MALGSKFASSPEIAMLCFDAATRASSDGTNFWTILDKMEGTTMNPNTFSVPLRYVRVKGANSYTTIKDPTSDLAESFINQIKKLQTEGIKAIITSCGFNIIYQKILTESPAVQIPVWTSPMLQLPSVLATIGDDKYCVLITSNSPYLTFRHFENAGVDKDTVEKRIVVAGMESVPEWRKHETPQMGLNPRVLVAQLNEWFDVTMKELNSKDKIIGAVLMECTALCFMSNSIRKKYALPVYDMSTMVDSIDHALNFNSRQMLKAKL